MTDFSLSHTHKFRRWKGLLEEHGLKVHGIHEVYSKWRRADDLLFALVELDASTPEGHKIPPVCFIKGEIVSVLVCLIDEETGEKYNLLVKQRRICNGAWIYEQVAGMVDRDDDPLAVAVKEVEEETGVHVRPDQVHRLNDEVLFSSTGTSDEAMHFFYCELRMSHEQIWSYHAQAQGEAGENEHIITHVATFPEAKRLITNCNGLLNIFLYEALSDKQ
ncbi:MAG: NUDIX hydrolase [Bacteroidia bacterium]